MKRMRGVVFTPDRNVKRADYTGAFKPEAEGFAREHGIPPSAIHPIDITQSREDMRIDVTTAIEEEFYRGGLLETVAFFCHGWKTGIQLGFSLGGHDLTELADACEHTCTENVVVPLYACSTARDDDMIISDDQDPENTVGGDGGFANELREYLGTWGLVSCRVVGHVTAGHSTFNPWVRFFDGPRDTGGHWVITPKGALWSKWIAWLREKNADRKDRDNQFKFPFWSIDDIRESVMNYNYKTGVDPFDWID